MSSLYAPPQIWSVDIKELASTLKGEIFRIRGPLTQAVTLCDLSMFTADTHREASGAQQSSLQSREDSHTTRLVICLERSYLKALRQLTPSALIILSYQEWRNELEDICSSREPLALVLVDRSKTPAQLLAKTLRWFAMSAHESNQDELIHGKQCNATALIHPTAQIDPTAQIHPTASIGAFTVVERGAIIKKDVVIATHCYIGPDVLISEKASLSPRVTILEGCEVGAQARLHTGAVIGENGFGLDEHGQLPHLGSVSIRSEVRVGALTCIDRATLGQTVIGEGSQLDNLIQVGHNARIGDRSIICAQSGLAGRASLGSQVTLGGQVGVTHGAHIVSGSRIAAKSGVTKTLRLQGEYSGFPAEPHRERLKREVILRKSLGVIREKETFLRPLIHPSAQVHPSADIHPTAVIGARSVISSGCMIGPYAIIGDGVSLGERCEVASFAVIGAKPQLRSDSSPTQKRPSLLRLNIGARNRFHEGVSISSPAFDLPKGRESLNTIGDDNLFMAYSHLGHDCIVGHGCTLSNRVSVAGHVTIGDQAQIGGHAAIHQFVHLGTLSFVAAGALVSGDVPPYCLAAGDRARLYGLNTVGLKRAGFSAELRLLLKRSYRHLIRPPVPDDLLGLIRSLELDFSPHQAPQELKNLLEGFTVKRRPICRSKR